MGKVIAFGDTAVGVALSTNPVLLLLGFPLVVALKTAGYIGLDRFLLPLLGTPWKAPKPATAPGNTAPLPQPV